MCRFLPSWLLHYITFGNKPIRRRSTPNPTFTHGPPGPFRVPSRGECAIVTRSRLFSALVKQFVEHHAGRRRDIERIAFAHHRNAHYQVAHGLKLWGESFAFVANEQDDRRPVADLLIIPHGARRGASQKVLGAPFPAHHLIPA